MSELDLKLQRIQDLLRKQQAEALLLNRVSSFAWATCGALVGVRLPYFRLHPRGKILIARQDLETLLEDSRVEPQS